MSDVLANYATRGWISNDQERAGCLFLDDFKSMTRPGRFPGYEKRVRSNTAERGFDMSGIGRARFHKACRHLGELRHIAFAVCIEARHAHEWAVEHGHKKEDGIAVLRLALTSLHRFYSAD